MEQPSGRAPAPTSPDSELTPLSLEGPSHAVGHSIPAPRESQKQPGRWVPPGEPVTIANITLPDGMVYVGTQLSAHACAVEPALINPFMRVAPSEYDCAYFDAVGRPTYSILSPQNKKAFLRWLQRGRADPRANIGYVFLFFYGLERHVLCDPAVEVEVIAQEVRRLLEIYGDSRQFAYCAQRLLEALTAMQTPSRSYLATPTRQDDWPGCGALDVRMAMGQMARDQYPVPPEWALVWAQSNSNVRATRIARGYPSKFAEIFMRRYRLAHNEGLVLSANPTRLSLKYSPASPGFSGAQPVPLAPVPDVSAALNHSNKLQGLVNGCSVLLEPYCKLHHRLMGQVTPFDELLTLPADIWSDELLARLEHLQTELDAEGFRFLTLAELLELFGAAQALSRSSFTRLIEVLATVGIAVEPELRASSPAPKPADPVALLQASGELEASPGYAAAAVLSDYLCGAGLFEGDAADTALGRYLEHARLPNGEKLRLRARQRITSTRPPSFAALKKASAPLAGPVRRALGQTLAFLTETAKVATPSQVKVLEKVYRTLDLDSQWVYSDLHAGALPDLEAGLLDDPAATTAPHFALDVVRIAQLQAETAAVSALLSQVFVLETGAVQEVDASPETPDLANAGPCQAPTPQAALLGLDAAHSALVRILVTRDAWPATELACAAEQLGLLLGGALEIINEASLDTLDEVLTEGDDPVTVIPETAASLAAA